MKIRSANEIQSLDDEINIFEEADWDFMSVVDNHDENFEYFNDIRDTDFDKRRPFKFSEHWIPIVATVCALIVCSSLAIKVSGILDNDDYEAVQNIASVNQATNSNYVEGVEAESSELIDINKLLADYFTCLNTGSNYDDLYAACATTSNFADTYYAQTNKVQTLYDTNDCYARCLRKFGTLCRLNKINKVLIKDDIYYCYLDVTIPVTTDVIEYIRIYSYNFTKKFASGVLDEGSVVQFLLDTMETSTLPCSSTEICLKVVKKNGEFKLSDDTYITSTCSDAYTTAMSQLSSILGGNLTSSYK